MQKKRGRPTKSGSVLHELRLMNERLAKVERLLHRVLKEEEEIERIIENQPSINLEAHLVKGLTQ